jgi:gamma-glutamylaminecyclotransferase
MRSVTERCELFVYGTLMRGEHHHDVMVGAEFIAEAETLPAYELVLIDYFPAMLEGGSTRVRGELYRVDRATLARLDALEEVPHYYVRASIALSDGQSAETYLMPRERAANAVPIRSGSFRAR